MAGHRHYSTGPRRQTCVLPPLAHPRVPRPETCSRASVPFVAAAGHLPPSVLDVAQRPRPLYGRLWRCGEQRARERRGGRHHVALLHLVARQAGVALSSRARALPTEPTTAEGCCAKAALLPLLPPLPLLLPLPHCRTNVAATACLPIATRGRLWLHKDHLAIERNFVCANNGFILHRNNEVRPADTRGTRANNRDLADGAPLLWRRSCTRTHAIRCHERRTQPLPVTHHLSCCTFALAAIAHIAGTP
jgi:hypothetical protein